MPLRRAAIEVQFFDRSHAIPGERKVPLQQLADNFQGSAEEHQRRARYVARAVLASGDVITLGDRGRIDEMKGQAADMRPRRRSDQRVVTQRLFLENLALTAQYVGRADVELHAVTLALVGFDASAYEAALE